MTTISKLKEAPANHTAAEPQLSGKLTWANYDDLTRPHFQIRLMENKMETAIVWGARRTIILNLSGGAQTFGLPEPRSAELRLGGQGFTVRSPCQAGVGGYRDNGKQHGNCFNGLYRI